MVELPKLSPSEIAIGAGITAIATGVGTAAIVHHYRKKKKSNNSKNRKKSNRRVSRRKIKFGSKAYRRKYLKHGKRRRTTPYTAGKRRDTSHRRIRYTSRGQPYVIGSHGKARFISRRSAKSSYKRAGGKY